GAGRLFALQSHGVDIAAGQKFHIVVNKRERDRSVCRSHNILKILRGKIKSPIFPDSLQHDGNVRIRQAAAFKGNLFALQKAYESRREFRVAGAENQSSASEIRKTDTVA